MSRGSRRVALQAFTGVFPGGAGLGAYPFARSHRRVTTLLYALPDGAAVPRVGLLPTYRFPFEPAEGKIDREATMKNAPPSWLGPDVRGDDHAEVFPPVPWPPPTAGVGPCRDPNVCRAIELLGDDKKRVASSRQK